MAALTVRLQSFHDLSSSSFLPVTVSDLRSKTLIIKSVNTKTKTRSGIKVAVTYRFGEHMGQIRRSVFVCILLDSAVAELSFWLQIFG